MRVEAVVEVRPTESLEKVKRALLNVISPSSIEERRGEYGAVLVATCEGARCLERLRAAIWRQGIQDAARAVMSRGVVSGDTVVFSLNKQAAYVGVVSFATEPGESPLGPITITVRTSSPRQLLDWLAPRTYRGRVFYEVPPPD